MPTIFDCRRVRLGKRDRKGLPVHAWSLATMLDIKPASVAAVLQFSPFSSTMPKTHQVHTAPAAETVIKPWTYTDEQKEQIKLLREVRRNLGIG